MLMPRIFFNYLSKVSLYPYRGTSLSKQEKKFGYSKLIYLEKLQSHPSPMFSCNRPPQPFNKFTHTQSSIQPPVLATIHHSTHFYTHLLVPDTSIQQRKGVNRSSTNLFSCTFTRLKVSPKNHPTHYNYRQRSTSTFR